MRHVARHSAAATAPLVGLLSIAAPNITPANAASTDCAPNIGTKTPVILVHGLLSDTSVWGSDLENSSMVHALDLVPSVHVTTFDYSTHHTRWVTDQHIGPALAQQINCEAAASRAAGGAGKVVVIGHSMGGLAIRFAAAQKVHDQPVANDIGLVITIATPNLGSGLANEAAGLIHALCDAAQQYDCDQILSARNSAFGGLADGSQQLKQLAWLPRTIPTLAIAGDVTLHAHAFQVPIAWTVSSDLVVAKASALQDIRKVNGSGGSATISCDQDLPLSRNLPSCWHSGLPHDATVEQQVLHALGIYLHSRHTSVFAGIAGLWSVHGGQTIIATSGTGSDTWNDGPCTTSLESSNPVWCTGHASFQLTAGPDGKFTGTYTHVWIASSTGTFPPGYIPDPTLPKAGDSFTIWRNDAHTLARRAANIANPYLCDSYAESHYDSRCGA